MKRRQTQEHSEAYLTDPRWDMVENLLYHEQHSKAKKIVSSILKDWGRE